uniref:Unannotated protein n=1 Tax=freshwater metagenome TaxID=449393 RepID=A0A6J5ZVV4_9ZZZZ
MVVAVILPRFPLAIAAGGRAALAEGPLALAPEPGRAPLVGEVSAAAEALGVAPGMKISEALARAPALKLIAADPVAVADAWEKVLVRLESVGAEVEDGGVGLACFEAGGLGGLHGGSLDAVVKATRSALKLPARIGAGPSRFCAVVAASQARSRRPSVVNGADQLSGAPVTLLAHNPATAKLPEQLARFGITALGQLAALPRDSVADRFGRAGIAAWELAHGNDGPLRPRRPSEPIDETLTLTESASGPQLASALELLVDRLLARSELGGRTLRAATLSAHLAEGGTWRERVVFREPLSDAFRIRTALSLRLALLPAPAQALRLAAEQFGPAAPAAEALFDDAKFRRAGRLSEAIGQLRALAGPQAALRVLLAEPDSRIPERRVVLTPYER